MVLKKTSESIEPGNRTKKIRRNKAFPEFFVFSVVVALAPILLAGCGKAADSASGSATQGSAQGNGNVSDTLGFAVTGVANSYPNILTQQLTTSPSADVTAAQAAAALGSTSCAIAPPATGTTQTPTDMLCISNVQEGDLYVHGMGIGVNVPTNMCEYYWTLPYYYYALRPGTIDGDTYNVVTNASTGLTTSCSRTNAAGATTAGVVSGGTICSFPDHEVTLTGTALSCAYDYSLSDSTLPNCCEGSYVLNSTDGTNATSTPGSYGGLMSNCLRGPAMMGSWPVDKNGFPEPVIVDVASIGKNYQYQIPVPIASVADSNLLVTNMFDWSAYQAGTFPAALSGSPSTTIPIPLVPGTDLTGSAVRPAHPYYEFRCLDRDFETMDRIRLFIASWTTATQYFQYTTTGSGTLNVPGTETGGACIGVYGPCDDELGWDDLASGVYPGLPF